MAEFQEVMRQWARMCNSVPGKGEHRSTCSDKKSGYICPMEDCGLCNKSLSSQTNDDRLIGERIIMSWAAEHPEPVYPSWLKWLTEQGIVFYKPVSETESRATIYAPRALKPIPADLAKKLGIEPKEG